MNVARKRQNEEVALVWERTEGQEGQNTEQVGKRQGQCRAGSYGLGTSWGRGKEVGRVH